MIRKCNFAGVASSLKYLQGNYRLRGNSEGFEVEKEKIRASRGSVPVHLSFMAKSWKPLGKDASVCRSSGVQTSRPDCRLGRRAVSQVTASDRGHCGIPYRRPPFPVSSKPRFHAALILLAFGLVCPTGLDLSRPLEAGRSALCLTS